MRTQHEGNGTGRIYGPGMIALLRMMTLSHIAMYRLTGGRLGGRIAGNPVLLLTTKGRKTGKRRTRPLLYLPDGDQMVVVGSAGNSVRHPQWWSNLQANPRAEVQLGRTTYAIEAEFLAGAVKDQLWARLGAAFPRFGEMQQQTSRELPVVRLRPVTHTS
jgi:deazaflavin-dependent oxidoreductase (nitroreductase family)